MSGVAQRGSSGGRRGFGNSGAPWAAGRSWEEEFYGPVPKPSANGRKGLGGQQMGTDIGGQGSNGMPGAQSPRETGFLTKDWGSNRR